LPFPLAFGLASVDELRCLVLRDAEPIIPLEGVWMGREKMFVSSEKAEEDLGYIPGSASDALGSAVAWFRDQGYA
jgi:dihydroflavonol-4-reductase